MNTILKSILAMGVALALQADAVWSCEKCVGKPDTARHEDNGKHTGAGRQGARKKIAGMMLKRFDANHDGALDQVEIRAMVDTIADGKNKQQSGGEDCDPEHDKKRDEHRQKARQKFIDKFDTNKDGVLDESERVAAVASITEKQAQLKARLLEKFDRNGDGILDETEKEQARRERQKHCGEGDGRDGAGDGRRREKILKKFDKDGDGELNDAERAEAEAALEKRKAEMHAKLLERFDKNGDGELDEDERHAAREEFRKRHGKDAEQ